MPRRTDHAVYRLSVGRLIATAVLLGAITGCASPAPPLVLARAWAQPAGLKAGAVVLRFDGGDSSALRLGAGWALQDVSASAAAARALCRGPDGDAVSILASPGPADFDARVTAQPRLGGGETLGLAFRVQDAERYYLARLNSRTNGVRLYRRDGASWYLLDSRNLPVPVGRWQELNVRAEGTHLVVGVGGEPLLQADDESYAGGGFALWLGVGSVGCFDELSVAPLPARR